MKRRLASCLLLAASLAPCSLAAPAATGAPAARPATIIVQPKFAVGQKYSFDTVLERRETRPDGTTPMLRIAVPSTLEVVAASGEGWAMEWRDGAPRISSEGFDPSRLAAARVGIDAAEGLGLRFTTDADGIPQEALNAGEFATRLGAVLRSIADTSFDPASKAIAADLITRLTRPEMIAAGVLRAPSLLLASGGSALAPGESVTTTATLDNAFGGPPLPSKLGTKLAPLAPGSDTVSLSITQAIDPVAAKDAVVATLANLGVPRAEMPSMTLEIVESGTWTLDRATFLPRSLEHVRTMKFGPVDRVEKRTFKSIPSTPDPVPRRAIPAAAPAPTGQGASP